MEKQPFIRKAGVAGMFYPSDPSGIIRLLEAALDEEKENIRDPDYGKKIIGAVLPHAGMVYCARQTVHFFANYIRQEKAVNGDLTVVIVHPNHAGYGPELSTDGHDFWETPLGRVSVDSEFTLTDIPLSEGAQKGEHSAEVILPYLQYFLKDGFRIVSINMLGQDQVNARFVAEKVFEAEKRTGRRVLLIASSDFSHFLSPEEGRELDDLVLQRILNKEPKAVYDIVKKHNISVCGYGPVMALMEYASMLPGHYKVHLLNRGHSGEVSPSKRVVNYNSLLFEI